MLKRLYNIYKIIGESYDMSLSFEDIANDIRNALVSTFENEEDKAISLIKSGLAMVQPLDPPEFNEQMQLRNLIIAICRNYHGSYYLELIDNDYTKGSILELIIVNDDDSEAYRITMNLLTVEEGDLENNSLIFDFDILPPEYGQAEGQLSIILPEVNVWLPVFEELIGHVDIGIAYKDIVLKLCEYALHGTGSATGLLEYVKDIGSSQPNLFETFIQPLLEQFSYLDSSMSIASFVINIVNNLTSSEITSTGFEPNTTDYAPKYLGQSVATTILNSAEAVLNVVFYPLAAAVSGIRSVISGLRTSVDEDETITDYSTINQCYAMPISMGLASDVTNRYLPSIPSDFYMSSYISDIMWYVHGYTSTDRNEASHFVEGYIPITLPLSTCIDIIQNDLGIYNFESADVPVNGKQLTLEDLSTIYAKVSEQSVDPSELMNSVSALDWYKVVNYNIVIKCLLNWGSLITTGVYNQVTSSTNTIEWNVNNWPVYKLVGLWVSKTHESTNGNLKVAGGDYYSFLKGWQELSNVFITDGVADLFMESATVLDGYCFDRSVPLVTPPKLARSWSFYAKLATLAALGLTATWYLAIRPAIRKIRNRIRAKNSARYDNAKRAYYQDVALFDQGKITRKELNSSFNRFNQAWKSYNFTSVLSGFGRVDAFSPAILSSSSSVGNLGDIKRLQGSLDISLEDIYRSIVPR